MQLNGKRSYGKIASLPPEVRNAVDNMILTCTVRLPEIQAYIEAVSYTHLNIEIRISRDRVDVLRCEFGIPFSRTMPDEEDE